MQYLAGTQPSASRDAGAIGRVCATLVGGHRAVAEHTARGGGSAGAAAGPAATQVNVFAL